MTDRVIGEHARNLVVVAGRTIEDESCELTGAVALNCGISTRTDGRNRLRSQVCSMSGGVLDVLVADQEVEIGRAPKEGVDGHNNDIAAVPGSASAVVKLAV